MIAHAARRAEGEDIVVAVFDVRRAYFYAEEKRDTFVELPDNVPAEFRTTHVGKLRKALVRNSPSCSIVERRVEKRARQLQSHRWHCVAVLFPQ